MACGTGKTFTSLRLAEENVGAGGKVLFLVPSICLLSQTVREWVAEAEVPIRPLAVCSDAKATRRTKSNDERGHLRHRPRASRPPPTSPLSAQRIVDAQADTTP